MENNIPKSISEAKELMKKQTLRPSELVSYYQKNIEEKSNLNAVLEFYSDSHDYAKESDRRYAEASPRELEGIPFLVKDCILVKGHVASAGSQMLAKYVAPYDATCIRLIKEAGGIILGRTNMDEFALGGSGENSSYGKTLNPLNTTKVPGGSSSGSAAALAANLCLVALGSDTGGSVRQPASFCGLYGFKPSYGSISRNGLIAAASSLDTIGIFGNTPDDVETVFQVISKPDTMDNTTIPESTREELKLKNSKVTTKKVFYPKEYVESEGINEEVKNDFYNSLEIVKKMGYEVEEASMDTLKYALSMYYIINTAEVSTNLSRMDGLRFGGGDVGEVKNYQELFAKNRGKFFGPEVKRRIMIGSYVLSHGYFDAFYGKSKLLQTKMRAEFSELMTQAPIFLLPTAPTTAFTSGEKKDPLTLYLEDIFTVPANLLGIPGISIPTEKDSSGLPLSLQVLSDYGNEEAIFDFVKSFVNQKKML